MSKPANCPRCGNPNSEYVSIDAGLRLSLASSGEANIPPIVCPACYDQLSKRGSAGVQLRAEAKAKEHNRNMLWKSRVNLVKQARQLMEGKAFSQAAVAYEKYIRTLEIVYGLKPGELTPNIFNNSSRSKEMTVIATVYWDLFRIYDTSPRYGERMKKAATKLVLFLPYSTVFADISRKIESFARSAKNPHIVRDLVKDVNKGRLRCFVATAVFPAPYSPEVLVLRDFRDQFLKTNALGRQFVAFYYKNSPRWVIWMDNKPHLKAVIRNGLRLMTWFVKKLTVLAAKDKMS